MPQLKFFAALLLLSCHISDAKVEFSHSTMYDIYDFVESDEVALPRCDNGCLIFASAFGIYEGVNMDRYILNLTVNAPELGYSVSLGDLVHKFHPETSQKLPLDIQVKGKYSIVNLNGDIDMDTHYVEDIRVWVIERARAQEIDYEIYDAASNIMKRPPMVPGSVITIMAGMEFTVKADMGWEVNSYSVRLVGFDNAFDDNEDSCDYVARTPVGSMFDGFEFNVQSPIASFVFHNRSKINITASTNCCNKHFGFSSPGFFTSHGYHGCSRVKEFYRSNMYAIDDRMLLTGGQKHYQVTIDSIMDLSGDHEIQVTDTTTGTMIPIGGADVHYQVTLAKTQSVTFSYANVTAPESFLIRYTTKRNDNSPTSQTTASTPAAQTTTAHTQANDEKKEEKKNPSGILAALTTTTSATRELSYLALTLAVCFKMLHL